MDIAAAYACRFSSMRPRFGRERRAQTLKRVLLLLSTSTLLHLAQVVCAYASISCQRIEQLPGVSDTRTLKLLDAYAKVLAPSKAILIKQIDDRFLLAFPDDHKCKKKLCHYRLLDSKNHEIQERFVFQGTGFIFFLLSSTRNIDDFQDRFHTIVLETSPQTYIEVDLPFRGDVVLVGGVSGHLFRVGSEAAVPDCANAPAKPAPRVSSHAPYRALWCAAPCSGSRRPRSVNGFLAGGM
jgi:hypothetical protein